MASKIWDLHALNTCISPHRKANSFHAPVARTDKQSLVQLEQQL
jgi:hypothetical protein